MTTPVLTQNTGPSLRIVIPAKAGIQSVKLCLKDRFKPWTPAFAGVTANILRILP